MAQVSKIPPQATPISRVSDPVIEAYKAGIDRTLLIENLRLTPQQRVDQMIELLETIETFQEAGARARQAR